MSSSRNRPAKGCPARLVGDDLQDPEAKPAGSFEELVRIYRTHRCLLHVTRQEWEDGYNLSTLEAMAAGMPVVSLANRTSPLTDGVDGFTSDDPEVLRGRLQELLNDRDLARAIGERGRETVAKKFPIERFAENWREAILTAAERSPPPQGAFAVLRSGRGGTAHEHPPPLHGLSRDHRALFRARPAQEP